VTDMVNLFFEKTMGVREPIWRGKRQPFESWLVVF
jgi:hypothetical protein